MTPTVSMDTPSDVFKFSFSSTKILNTFQGMMHVVTTCIMPGNYSNITRLLSKLNHGMTSSTPMST